MVEVLRATFILKWMDGWKRRRDERAVLVEIFVERMFFDHENMFGWCKQQPLTKARLLAYLLHRNKIYLKATFKINNSKVCTN